MEEDTDNLSEGGLAVASEGSVTGSGGATLPVFLNLDETFEGLDHFRRRYLSLLAYNQPVDLVDAAAALSHVPKLSALGILPYDKDERSLEPGQDTTHVESHIQGSGRSFDRAESVHEQYNPEVDDDAH